MQHFFSLCSDQGISKETCACLLRSINTQSLCAYLRSWKDFTDWCYTGKIGYGSLSVNTVCAYLIYLFKKGHQVSYLNVARSSLSFFLSQIFEIGEHPRIKRLFRFFWRRRPSFPRYFVTWDIRKVLKFLSDWHPINRLTFKQITLKALSLVALTSSDRAQTLESIDIEHSEVSEEGIFFPIYTLLKSSRRNRPIRVVKCIRFDDPSLDVLQLCNGLPTKNIKISYQCS